MMRAILFAFIERIVLEIRPAPDPGSVSVRLYSLASSVHSAQTMKMSKPRITSDHSG